MKISLLHATWFADQSLTQFQNLWIGHARTPAAIEYVVAMEEGDEKAIRDSDGMNRLVLPAMVDEAMSSAVRNWNAAASSASGDLLFVISDDLVPSQGWDEKIRTKLATINPLNTAFALKIMDSENKRDTNLTHPIISRAFFEEFGLFNPSYTHLYVDLDLTIRAFWNSVIFDGRDIEFRHLHPSLDPQIGRSKSHTKGNSANERARGRKIFESEWPALLRVASIHLLKVEKAGGGLSNISRSMFIRRLASLVTLPLTIIQATALSAIRLVVRRVPRVRRYLVRRNKVRRS